MADRSYHHGNLRRALLDAALAIIGEHDVSALTMAALARAAKVSSGAPYRHFKSVHDVLIALATEGWSLMVEQETALVAQATTPLERFRQSGIAAVRFAVTHPTHYTLMCGPVGRALDDPALNARIAEGESQTHQMVAAAVAAREMGKQGVAVETLAAQALIYGLARMFVDGALPVMSADEAEELARSVTNVLGVGLRPRPDCVEADCVEPN